MTYARGGNTRKLDSFSKGRGFVEDIAEVAQVPGGLDMLMTMAAEELGVGEGGGSKQVRLYNMGGSVGEYGDGGLAQAAEMTRSGGRGDDEMLVHMSPEEYEAIESMWGKADINPNTGIPEYGFLSKLWKGVKKTVKKVVKSPMFSFLAPIALNVFAPGLGSAVGGWLGATGRAASTLGNTLVRSGLGAISGGKNGAISGALSGLTSAGVGRDIGNKLGLGEGVGKVAGDALLGGVAGEATGVGFGRGATGQAMQSLLNNPLQKIESGLTNRGREMFGTEGGGIFGREGVGDGVGYGMSPVEGEDPFGYGVGQPDGPMSPIPSSGDLTVLGNPSSGNFLSRTGDWMREHPWLTAGGALAAGSLLGGGGGQRGGNGPPQLPDEFTTSLPNLSFDRTAMPIQDYYNYGRASAENPGEATFFSGNTIDGLPQTPSGIPPNGYPPWMGRRGPGHMEGGRVMAYKLGGLVQKYAVGGSAHIRGPGTGRSDDIPAVLSDGEYVIDSETVALLGDGSTDAGARRLDEMRNKLRKHKGKKLAKGGFSDAAKTPEEYMAEGGKVKQTGGVALRDLKRLANRLEQAVESGNKKRVAEITATLKSLDSGDKVVAGLAKGGNVKRIIESLERTAEYGGEGSVVGKTERRLTKRRKTERKEDVGKKRRLSDKERLKLAEELGGFKKNSRFIRNLKRKLEKEKEKS